MEQPPEPESLGQVTISVEKLDALRNAVRDKTDEAADLRRQLADARACDPSGRVADLATLARTMLVVVRFAVANLPPMEIRRWPRDAVRAIADGLAQLPDFNDDDATLAQELRYFAAEIEQYDLQRGREQADAVARGRDKEASSKPTRKLRRRG